MSTARKPACWAVIPAAGQGRRFGGTVPKQHLQIGGQTLLEHSLRVLLGHPEVCGAVLVLAAGDGRWRMSDECHGKPVMAVVGGGERSASVLNGLRGLAARASGADWVLVHDAARPCLLPADLDRLIRTLRDDPVGGILATPARDTLKRGVRGRIIATVARTSLWHAMTPQMFRYQLLLECLQDAAESGVEITDEAAAVERAGYQPHLVEGSWENFKITQPEDLRLAELLLDRRRVDRIGT